MKQLLLFDKTFASVDDEDYERLTSFVWYVSKTSISRNFQQNGKVIIIPLANEIMQKYNVMFDHRDVDKRNNQKYNLRITDHVFNMANTKKRPNCSSKYKGVCWYKRTKQWKAYIKKYKKCISLGYHNSEIEAAIAYDDKALEIFGEHARLNFSLYGA